MPTCELCDRNLAALTVHHLVPRQHTKRKHLVPGPTIEICAACHRQLPPSAFSHPNTRPEADRL